jgi:hypothetical protein
MLPAEARDRLPPVVPFVSDSEPGLRTDRRRRSSGESQPTDHLPGERASPPADASGTPTSTKGGTSRNR